MDNSNALKLKPRFVITWQAETELQKAVSNTAMGSQALNRQMREFEKEKLADLKVL